MGARTITGELEYITDGIGVEGRERFEITCLDDGRRTLCAVSEMTNDNIVRHTLLAVDEQWRPVSAQLHLTRDKYTGSGSYLFDKNGVHFLGRNTQSGVVSQTRDLASPVRAFGGHAIQNDAWLYGAFDQWRKRACDAILPNTVVSSHASNGGDGPDLIFTDQHHRFLGEEMITTAAGEFETRRYEFVFEDRPSIQYWVTGQDYVIVRCRWDLLNQTYDLVRLEISNGG